MAAIVLGQAEVRQLLPMDRCIQLVESALKRLSSGDALNPLRRGMLLRRTAADASVLAGRDGALLGMMPAYLDEPEALGVKVLAVFPSNAGTPYDSHQGVVIVFDTQHGCPQAIIDASEVTAIRTAAASGVATRLLARDDAGDLAIIGSGVQARTHLEAMRCVRALRRVRVFSPNEANRSQFAELESERHGIVVEAVASARTAVEGADIVCTTTSASEPVVLGQWLSPGAHVNAAGACTPRARELDGRALAESSLFTDCRESLFAESGDFLIARDEGLVDDADVRGEIGEVLLGETTGRERDEEITLFNSLGVGVEDMAAARYLIDQARVRGVGVEVELGGLKHAPLA